jgi:Flp pilus assembly protein TadB
VSPAAALSALAAGCAVWWALSTPAAARRLQSLATPVTPSRGGNSGAPARRVRIDATSPVTRAVASVGAGCVVAVLVGGWVGLVVGAITCAAMFKFVRGLESVVDRRRVAAIVAALPMGATLLAACLRAGRPVEPSVAAVGAALGGPLGDEFVRVAASLALGAAPSQAWRRLLDQPATARFARTLVRTWESGAPLAETLESLAVACRATAKAAAQERAKAVGVKTAAPLGLCFLPAFVAVGLVPVIVGVVSGVIASLF